MLFNRINIRSSLVRERNSQQRLLRQANDILNASFRNDAETLERLKKSSDQKINFSELINSENIFSLEEIKKVCIRYRLRFLDTSYFRPPYPYTAISEINDFEKKSGIKIKSFKIIAPSKAFDLENINKDPILFAELSNNKFYLLHQWGTELSWHRKLLTWPLQNFKTLLITLFLFCFAFSFSIPSSDMNIFSLQSEIYLRIWLSIHTFIGLLGLVLWAGLSFDKTFSSLNWNSKYYNY